MPDAPWLAKSGFWPVAAPLPPGVQAVMTTRHPGASIGLYGGFNLATHVGDDAGAVIANRQRLAEGIGAHPVFLDQVHGVTCVPVAADTPDGIRADAAFTTQAGVACVVMVADCLPVLLWDRAGRQVAAAHAGWRGLAQGVLGTSVASFNGIPTAELTAWLGPCIGPTCFEVGEDVRVAFGRWSADLAQAPWFVPRNQAPGKFWCDLAGLARWWLERQGVGQVLGNDGSAPWCTVSQPDAWFSHRRDGAAPGGTGRMAACIWREAPQ